MKKILDIFWMLAFVISAIMFTKGYSQRDIPTMIYFGVVLGITLPELKNKNNE